MGANGADEGEQVDLSKLQKVAQWDRNYTMERILLALRE